MDLTPSEKVKETTSTQIELKSGIFSSTTANTINKYGNVVSITFRGVISGSPSTPLVIGKTPSGYEPTGDVIYGSLRNGATNEGMVYANPVSSDDSASRAIYFVDNASSTLSGKTLNFSICYVRTS